MFIFFLVKIIQKVFFPLQEIKNVRICFNLYIFYPDNNCNSWSTKINEKYAFHFDVINKKFIYNNEENSFKNIFGCD